MRILMVPFTISTLALVAAPRAVTAQPGPVRWFVPQPHPEPGSSDDGSPFVSVGREGLTACRGRCASWSRVGDSWREVGFWGDDLGPRRVVGITRFDTSPLTAYRTDRAGVEHLHVRGPWTPSASARWEAPAAVRRLLEDVARSLERLVADPAVRRTGTLPPITDRVWSFRTRLGERELRVGVVAGPVLAVLHLAGRDRWILDRLDTMAACAFDGCQAEPFRILAITDLNDDGSPEIGAVQLIAESWEHFVLQIADDGPEWREVARTSGSTV